MMAEVVASRLLRRNIVDDGRVVVAEIVVDQAECAIGVTAGEERRPIEQ
jgi:hypothetical protein